MIFQFMYNMWKIRKKEKTMSEIDEIKKTLEEIWELLESISACNESRDMYSDDKKNINNFNAQDNKKMKDIEHLKQKTNELQSKIKIFCSK